MYVYNCICVLSRQCLPNLSKGVPIPLFPNTSDTMYKAILPSTSTDTDLYTVFSHCTDTSTVTVLTVQKRVILQANVYFKFSFLLILILFDTYDICTDTNIDSSLKFETYFCPVMYPCIILCENKHLGFIQDQVGQNL